MGGPATVPLGGGDPMSGGIRVEGVSKVFGHGRRAVEALGRVDLEIAANEFVAVVGVSGCGKSTLLSIIAGLERPTTGRVLVDDQPIDGPGRDRGVVFQGYTLFPWLTAAKNVEFALRDEPMSRRERRERAREQLSLVGLEQFASHYPRELSGGMRQRVAIARALSYRPRVLLMDEPFGALDALTRGQMQELLTTVWERHRLTVVFVTHDIDEAIFLADRVLLMSPRPGLVREDVPIDLARPRVAAIQLEPRFHELKADLYASVRRDDADGRAA
jgi:NitT/TauT family transport system ATP-binding protein